MPIYEYSCPGCGNEFELLIRGEEVPQCPHCESGKLEKLWSVPAPGRSDASSSPLPQAGCGLPQCGSGKCQFD